MLKSNIGTHWFQQEMNGNVTITHASLPIMRGTGAVSGRANKEHKSQSYNLITMRDWLGFHDKRLMYGVLKGSK